MTFLGCGFDPVMAAEWEQAMRPKAAPASIFEITYTGLCAMPSLDHAVEAWERVLEYAQGLGIEMEAGEVSSVEVDDLIPGSPFHKIVTEASS